MEKTDISDFDCRAFIATQGEGSISKYEEGKTIYRQGDPADAAFFIMSGAAKVIIHSEQGKAAMIAMLEAGDFFGEGCMDGNLLRQSTVVTANKCEIARFSRAAVFRALKDDLVFAKVFLMFLLSRNDKLRRDLVGHLFDSSEKRLARVLLSLANNGLANQSEFIDIPITQETLAMMVGTTRQHINEFMNKFRKFGYIDYNGHIKVRNSLMNVILEHDDDSK
jgi:CRP/FNR family cyclic AMP-dependent transcriptional regulator